MDHSLAVGRVTVITTIILIFIFVFYAILLFRLIRRGHCGATARLRDVTHSIHRPLSSTVLGNSVPRTRTVLTDVGPTNIIDHTSMILPGRFRTLHGDFVPRHPIPMVIAHLFRLPIRVSLNICSLRHPTGPRPVTCLILRTSSFHVCGFIVDALSALIAVCLLLSLVLAITVD